MMMMMMMMRRGRGDQNVVKGAAADTSVDASTQGSASHCGRQDQPPSTEATLEPSQHDGRRNALALGHPAQRRHGGRVRFVPWHVRGNGDARVWSDHLRTRSMAARASSAVRVFIAPAGSITGVPL